MSVLAIDVGGTKVALAMVSGRTIVARKEFPTPQNVARDLVDAIQGAAGSLIVDCRRIGVATTGIVRQGHVSSLNPETLAFPNNFPLQDMLVSAFGVPVFVANDAHAATWSEWRFGPGRGMAAFAYLTVSTGVGGGLVCANRLLQGENGLAGHFGHLTVPGERVMCGCGRMGCVEAIASGKSIEAEASQLLGRKIDARSVLELASNDARLSAVCDRAANAIVELMVSLKLAVDVDGVCVGGGVGLNPAFRARLASRLSSVRPLLSVRCMEPECGRDAGLLGIADLAVQP